MAQHSLAPDTKRRQIVLASTSPFRRQLLARLQIPFDIADPGTIEAPVPGELPQDTAVRLAIAKAHAIAGRFPDALIVGSDQVAFAVGQYFGKPGDRRRAVSQLAEMSGREIIFHTAVAVLDSATGSTQSACVPTEVRFRHLSGDEIERYVDADQPFNCAGSAKAESLGIALLEHVRGDDPTALIGLPLIALCAMLRHQGVPLP
ncbi:MAG: septum formation inhibitor Maf [Sterolibacteriaceae bacterium]|nr:septum formation inhibitor Maf [Candidatus Methylophosphatis haderslevensis]